MPQHDPRTDARTEPTTVYEATTRTRTLAPKLARMVAVSEAPVYGFITCGQRTPHARERALRDPPARLSETPGCAGSVRWSDDADALPRL